MRRITLITAALALTLTACGSDDSADPTSDGENTNETGSNGEVVTLTVGASVVPHADILNFIDENLAADAGIDLEVVEYTDYILPNQGLDSGELDANFFQHVPYFDAQVEENGYDFSHGEGIHIEPFGVYSEKIESLDDLEDGATISIVNDPSNQARALWLLEAEGVLDVADDVEAPTIFDIADNPKNIEFLEMDAANLPRTLADVDASIINGNFALEGGLKPSEDAIALESGEDNPYGNVLAWKNGSEKEDAIKKLDELLHSPEVADFITDSYPDGEVIPAFSK